MIERVDYWLDTHEDGTRITKWRCARCHSTGGATGAALARIYFGLHWKSDECTKALRMEGK